ncbi:hypothetical protein [Rhizobacter sp. LjRoot28]|jgi:hypothetical protein|uniref:hypothetical protein n=1 Tax=Rhizobacter sp. LjRoot28 TaxID=3342309 RepID=UPI003ED0C887
MHRLPARYLVMIDADGARTALLFTEHRKPAGEFDASSEEVSVMIKGLRPERTAASAEWDQALAGSSRSDRLAAEVFTLDV